MSTQLPDELEGQVVLISCYESLRGSGGLFALSSSGLEQLDDYSTMGMAYKDGRVARCVRDRRWRGVLETGFRFDVAESNPHDIAFDGEEVVVVATRQNALVWYSGGEESHRWCPNEKMDAWHLNCLSEHEGGLAVSLFGRFDEPEGWMGRHEERRGELLDLTTGAVLLRGLQAPHSAVRTEEGWVLCESVLGAVTEWRGEDHSTVEVADGWTRGLVVAGQERLVGVSPRFGSTGTAQVCWLGRKPVCELPGKDLYCMLAVPEEAVSDFLVGSG